MIAVAVVCAAAMSQAASMTWGQDTKIFMPDTDNGGVWSTTSLGSNGKAYYFELNKAAYDALFVENDYAATAEKVFNEYATVSDAGKITVSGQTGDPVSSKLGKFTYDDTRSFGKGDTAYAALILTTTGSDGKDYYIANIASYEFAADASGKLSDMAGYEFSNPSGTEIAGWTVAESVPEPTSGLLLLLGMAGLALRRRRA